MITPLTQYGISITPSTDVACMSMPRSTGVQNCILAAFPVDHLDKPVNSSLSHICGDINGRPRIDCYFASPGFHWYPPVSCIFLSRLIESQDPS